MIEIHYAADRAEAVIAYDKIVGVIAKALHKASDCRVNFSITVLQKPKNRSVRVGCQSIHTFQKRVESMLHFVGVLEYQIAKVNLMTIQEILKRPVARSHQRINGFYQLYLLSLGAHSLADTRPVHHETGQITLRILEF